MNKPDVVRIPIDRETHRLLRVEAAKQGVTIKKFIDLAIKSYARWPDW